MIERPTRAHRCAESLHEGFRDVVHVVEIADLIPVGDIGRLTAREAGDEVREQARRLLVAPEDVEEAEVDPADSARFAEGLEQLVLLGLVPRVGRARIDGGALVEAHAGFEHPGAPRMDDTLAAESRQLREQRCERRMTNGCARSTRPRSAPY